MPSIFTVHKNLAVCYLRLQNNNLADVKKVEGLSELFDGLFKIDPASKFSIAISQDLVQTYKSLNGNTQKLFKAQLRHSFSKLQATGDLRIISAYAQMLEPLLRKSNDK